MFAPILTLFTGAVGKYLLIGALSIGFLAWIRNDAAAPYRAEVSALRAASAQKERLLQADAARAEIDRFEHAREKAELEKIIEESRNPGACKLSGVELGKLYDLAAGRAN
jgi:uncharacterized protein YbjT (DUF2867 family)